LFQLVNTLCTGIYVFNYNCRYVVIVHPMKARSWCTMGNTRKIVIVVWLASILLSSPMLYISVRNFYTNVFLSAWVLQLVMYNRYIGAVIFAFEFFGKINIELNWFSCMWNVHFRLIYLHNIWEHIIILPYYYNLF